MFHLLTVFLVLALSMPSCAPHQVPSRGEPIRVGQVKDEELHLREIPLERYVAGVLEKEVHGGWPLEALKAQAVAARTYALYRKLKPRDTRFDVMADTTDQVFESDEGHSKLIVRAVLETEGETLQSGGKIFQAFFHSCCGGKSESANEVWAGAYPEPVTAIHDDPYCARCPPARWEHRIDRGEFASVEVSERDASGRAKTVLVSPRSDKPRTLPAIAFRQLLGNTNLKSTLFDVVEGGDQIVFEGRGAGHGVGLCQWGAKGMAEQGNSYREILDFYYPGAEIVPLSGEVDAR
jgi:stage II sporulation protein D